MPAVAHFNPLPQKQGVIQQSLKPLPTELLSNEAAQGAQTQQLNNQPTKSASFNNQNGMKNAVQMSSQPQPGKQPKFMPGGNPSAAQQNVLNK